MSEGCIERLVDGYHRGAWCTNRVTECIHYLHLPPGHPLAPVPALALANPPPLPIIRKIEDIVVVVVVVEQRVVTVVTPVCPLIATHTHIAGLFACEGV